MITNYSKRHAWSIGVAMLCRSRVAIWVLVMVASTCTFAAYGCGGSSATVMLARQVGREVLLLPILRGGAAGWCITVVSGDGCQIDRLKRGPILAEFWIVERGKSQAEGFAVTTSAVTAVEIRGSRPVSTRREPGLPQGLRALVVTARGAWAPEVKTPSLFGQPPHMAPSHLPRFIPLNRDGKPLPRDNEEGSLVNQPRRGKGWKPPASEPAGACELRTVELHRLVTNAGFVVTHATPVDDLFGRPFLSCASTSYSLQGWPIVASVLLDARHPGSRPARLPHMRVVAGSGDVFDALGSNGPMVARRIPGAWLVVSGGYGEARRQRLLKHLRAAVA